MLLLTWWLTNCRDGVRWRVCSRGRWRRVGSNWRVGTTWRVGANWRVGTTWRVGTNWRVGTTWRVGANWRVGTTWRVGTNWRVGTTWRVGAIWRVMATGIVCTTWRVDGIVAYWKRVCTSRRLAITSWRVDTGLWVSTISSWDWILLRVRHQRPMWVRCIWGRLAGVS